MNNRICQSCGIPLNKDPQRGGTNIGDSKSNTYCSYCYREGQFTKENLTVKDFQEFCRQEMIKSGHNKFMAWLLTRGMKRLERWKNNPPPVKISRGANAPASTEIPETTDFTNVAILILLYINEWEEKLQQIETPVFSYRRNEQDRTIKQIVGHMIDSASNNTHRIIHLQYQDSPLIFPDYAGFGNNDRWIAIQNYQKEDWNDLIQLWKYTNKHFAHIIQQINPAKINNKWKSATGEEISLETMVIDYIGHMALHLNEINELINNKKTI